MASANRKTKITTKDFERFDDPYRLAQEFFLSLKEIVKDPTHQPIEYYGTAEDGRNSWNMIDEDLDHVAVREEQVQIGFYQFIRDAFEEEATIAYENRKNRKFVDGEPDENLPTIRIITTQLMADAMMALKCISYVDWLDEAEK